MKNKPPVEATPKLNRPPIANAGADQNIILPTNNINLNGSGSIDPDNNISGYSWTKISGPSSPNIMNANAPRSQVTNLAEGIYQFELKVIDSAGVFSKDTVMINEAVVALAGQCRVINAKLTAFGTISKARYGMVAASAGNKILFAGGDDQNSTCTRVDIYNLSTNTWSIAELSAPRDNMTAAAIGDKVFFAGGYDGASSTRVDIYDATNDAWSTAELSKARTQLTSAVAGNKILFAGGYNPSYSVNGSDRVDIYDNSNNTWSIANLSQARWGASATTVGNKIYIAGGEAPLAPAPAISGIVNNVDIYDVLSNTWSYSTLGEAKGYMSSIAAGGKIYWMGGTSSIAMGNYVFSDKVEIRDPVTNISKFVQLCSPVLGVNAVAFQKDNRLLFFSGQGFGTQENKFVIYDFSSGEWSIGLYDQNLNGAAILIVGNKLYVAGGQFNGAISNQVWTLDF